MPALSAGKSMPVLRPKPNRVIHRASRSLPRSSAIRIAPTLDEWARIWATVIDSAGRGSASWITRSATWIVGGSQKEVDGETSPSESAPDTVTTLNVDPGSYVLSTVWLRWCGGQIDGKRLASYVGAFAIASTA